MKSKFCGRRKDYVGFLGRILAAIVLAFSMIFTTPFFSTAAEKSALPTKGTLAVTCSSNEELDKAGLVIDLYQVASASVSNDNHISYTALSGFTGISIGDDTSSSEWHNLAQQAAGIALDAAAGKSSMPPYKSGISLETRTELDTGLYLLVARNSEEDYVITTGTGEIATKASDGEDTYTFLPVLVSVPSLDAVSGELQYHVEVSLKAELQDQFGSLKIVKTLQGSDAGTGDVTFVFDVEAVLNGQKVYSNVVTMVFGEAGSKELVIDNLPAGAQVTVKELYSGARASLISSGTREATIGADEIASVSFTNQYDGRTNGGQSLTNHFRYEADGWKLDQLLDQSVG